MTRTDHRGKGNFAKNHANTGQKKSKVDHGNGWDKRRKNHWKDKAEKCKDDEPKKDKKDVPS